jgi:C4-type Zn-finger protein
MIIEEKTTKCPHCLKPLTWLSHTKQWTSNGEIDEFTFQCEQCKVQYMFRNDELTEKPPSRNPAPLDVLLRLVDRA